MYDGIWGNLALDLYSSWRSFRFFAEVAIDLRPAAALLCGLSWNPDYSLEMALMLRAYDKGYTATHAAAYSTLSGCYNQYGATASIKSVSYTHLDVYKRQEQDWWLFPSAVIIV